LQKLSESQIPTILPVLFKIMDLAMLCWNIYLVVTAVVLGWIVSSNDPLGWKQKLLISALYCLAIGTNSLALHKMFGAWLPPTLIDLKSEATTLDNTTPEIKKMFEVNPENLFLFGGKRLVIAVDLIAIPTVISCIWLLK
jgi:hypothetical protein